MEFLQGIWRYLLIAWGVITPDLGYSQNITLEDSLLSYKGKIVKGRALAVSSIIPIPASEVWDRVKTPALLEYVSRGFIQFKPLEEAFPDQWEDGHTYATRMSIFGCIPFGGVHHLHIEKIDESAMQIQTREWDNKARIWDHEVVIQDLGNGQTYYRDTIVIYGGFWTGLITTFARIFYKHRHKRWQKLGREELDIGG